MHTVTLPTDPASPADAGSAAHLRRTALRLISVALRSSGRAVSRCLTDVRRALRENRLDLGLRQLDRAWRCLPGDAAILAPLYGRLLLLEGRDHYAALGLLKRSLEIGPSPDDAALVALTLLRLERCEDARWQLEATLRQYCVVPGGTLFKVAGEIARHPAISAPGWVGRGPRLELLGELPALGHASVLEVAVDGGTSISQLLHRTPDPNAPCFFRFPSPSPTLHSPLAIALREVSLLGSPLCVPADFALDGRVTQLGS